MVDELTRQSRVFFDDDDFDKDDGGEDATTEDSGSDMDEEAIDVVAKAGADDRVDAVVMQTVGSKSHDGFLLAVVK